MIHSLESASDRNEYPNIPNISQLNKNISKLKQYYLVNTVK